VKGQNYLFSSQRLGFRPWSASDFHSLAALCADEDVMEHFPAASIPN
jgi:RimJ/RimL family protein N-acetyltransferase